MATMNRSCLVTLKPSTRHGNMLPVLGLIILLAAGGLFAYNHFQRDQEEFDLRRAHRALTLRHAQTLEQFELAIDAQKRIQLDTEAEIDEVAAGDNPNQEHLKFLQRSRKESINNQNELRASYHESLTKLEQQINEVVRELNERGLSAQ